MTAHITTHEAVETWKVAHRFVLDVYRLTNRLPRDEQTGLIPKVRTSTVKIASNIVEGYARKSTEFYLQHLSESQVALEETKYSLLVARDLGYVSEHQYTKIMTDAEGLSDRLERLQHKLSAALPAKKETAPLFGTGGKGVRETLGEALSWLKGGTERWRQKRDERQAQIWVEESNPQYLERAQD